MKNTIVKTIVLSLVVFFLVLVFAEKSGYLKTKEEKTKILTEEQIELFEKDIAQGKSVDINDYVIDNNKDYTNEISNNFYKVSLKLEKGVDGIIKLIFKGASKAVVD
jgi:uncharacterized protein (DUF2344 family)